MSGITTIPFLNKISSASGVVGPFAPSVITFALILSAFSEVIWFSKAHGARTSTSNSNNSAFVISFPYPLFAAIRPFSSKSFITASISIPFSL